MTASDGDGGASAVDLSLMEPVFQKYSGQPGALIPILQKAQDIYNYLPAEVLQLIAERLGIALSKVYGVATFYAQFYLERRGKHVLKICDGTACHVKGTPALITAVEEEFNVRPGETTLDGELTLEVVYCIGSCALAPATVLDGRVMGRMRPTQLLQHLRRHVSKTSVQET